MKPLQAFLLALILAAAATPVVIWLARRMGWVVAPREDRWHKKPTAVYGGVAIFLAYLIGFLIMGPHQRLYWVFLACSGAMFAIGLWDDALELKPQVKLLCQLIVAIVAVSQGLTLGKHIIPWAWLSVPITVLWLVGVTNAVNILDNMDGLSSGVVLAAGSVMALDAWITGSPATGLAPAMLAGAALGFFIYNFNPAKIFMGDCGSLFLGFTLAASAVLAANTAAGASHLAMALLVPLGALVVPLFDTTLVSFQRTTHGRSIAQGGRDHSSHRLVFLGLSEKRAVLTLLFISLAFGLGSLLLSHLASPLVAAVVVALLIVALAFFGVHLSDVKVYEDGSRRGWMEKSPLLGRVLLFKKQILQIVADVVLLSAAYSAAWLLRFEGRVTDYELTLLGQSLPWLLGAKLGCFWFFGLYRGEWRYLSVHDLLQIAKGCLAGSVLTALLFIWLYGFRGYSRAAMVIDLMLCYLFVAGSRGLVRIFREKVRGSGGVPCLILGAGDGGDLLMRELRNNASLPYKPLGFIDDDQAKQGHVIHGIKVLGTRQDLAALIENLKIQRVFISILSAPDQRFEDVFEVCAAHGIQCTRIQPIIKID